MISRMSYVEIIGIKEHLNSVVGRLHNFGKLQIEGIPLVEDFGETFLHKIHKQEKEEEEKKKREELSRMLEDILSHIPDYILSQLKEDIVLKREEVKEKKIELAKKGIREHYSYAAMIERQIKSFIRRRDNIKDDIQLLSNYKKVINVFRKIIPHDGWQEEYDIMGITINKSDKSILPVIQKELSRITRDDYKFISKGLDEKKLIAVIGFKKEYFEEVKNFIWNEKIEELKVPREFKDKPINEALATMEDKLKYLPQKLKEIIEEIDELFKEDGLTILLLNMMNKDRLNEMNAYSLFAQSQYTFIIKGWVPSEEVVKLRREWQEEFNGSVVINELSLKSSDYYKVPVLLSNPEKRQPFERLLAFFPLPKYGTLDATSLMAIFFPLFFGLILADMGYGVILVMISKLLAYYAKGRKLLGDISWIFLISAISTIIFGIIFGEFFGDIGKKLGLRPLWLEREEAIMPLLVLAIFIGLLHIMIGLGLGIVNAYLVNQRNVMWNTAIKMLILIGLLFIGGEVANFLPTMFFRIGVGILIIFVPLSLKLHGFMAPLEVVSTIGNILSYARIMAIGVASVILAVVANKLGTALDSLLLGIIVAVLLHTLNLVIGIFSPTIHSLRLHYVEFFSKFYIPGGRKYEPFKKDLE